MVLEQIFCFDLMAVGRVRAEKAANKYYPLDSRNGADLWDILSGPHVAYGLRKRVGEMLYGRGLLKTPEFRRAEERLEHWPKSPWTKEEVTRPGCHEALFARFKDVMVCVADTFRNSALRPETDCVWGPELTEDVTTREAESDCRIGRRGYISEVWHGEWCALLLARRAAAAETDRARRWHGRSACYANENAVLDRPASLQAFGQTHVRHFGLATEMCFHCSWPNSRAAFWIGNRSVFCQVVLVACVRWRLLGIGPAARRGARTG